MPSGIQEHDERNSLWSVRMKLEQSKLEMLSQNTSVMKVGCYTCQWLTGPAPQAQQKYIRHCLNPKLFDVQKENEVKEFCLCCGFKGRVNKNNAVCEFFDLPAIRLTVRSKLMTVH